MPRQSAAVYRRRRLVAVVGLILFLAVIGNALPVVKVSPFWQSALTGIVILVAVLINARGGRSKGRQILQLHLKNSARSAA